MNPVRRMLITVVAAATIVMMPGAARAQEDSCLDEPAMRLLDFWIGVWTVSVGDQQVGSNRIERILDGCAILEHWRSAQGGEGKSLFYYQIATESWKQVWVTGSALRPGGLKEKALIETFDDGGVRFQGEIPLPGGGSYLDRTTLIPRSDGSVRQLIEISRDDGESWQVTFDALYRRQE